MNVLPTEERVEVAETIAELVRDLYRDGSCDIRLVVSDMPREDWDEIDAPARRRYPEGDVKVERLAIGAWVEFVARPEEREAA